MTLKIHIGFLAVHLLASMGELWAMSAAGHVDVSLVDVGPISAFNSAMMSLGNVLSKPWGVLNAVGDVSKGLFQFYAFDGYSTVFSHPFEIIRLMLASVGFAVLFLTIWRIAPALIAAVISKAGRLLPF